MVSKLQEPCQTTSERMTFDSLNKKLVHACQKGDAQAQKDLYNLFAPKMYVVALRYSKSKQEAEDILQEGFVKIFQKIKTLKDHSRLQAWITRIIVNSALNINRSKLYMFPMYEVTDMALQTDHDFGLSMLGFKDLLQLIQSLPDGCQMIFNMYAIEGYSHKEIADKLGISPGTSKSQLARARMLLKSKLEEQKKISYGTI